MMMNAEWDKLEQAVERQAALLDRLRTPEPTAALLATVQAAVRHEAERVRQRERTWRGIRRVITVAAAVLLVAVLYRAPTAGPAQRGPSATFTEWAEAFEESHDRVTELVSDSWIRDDWSSDRDETGLEDLYDSLEQSLTIGA